MHTRNVNLTEELDRFVLAKIARGRYKNASEVARDVLPALERREREYGAKLDALRNAIDEYDAGGVVDGDVLGRIREKLNLLAASQ